MQNPDEEVEEEESTPCPICGSAEREDILLLCDNCDAAYHTHCIGLNGVPEGNWYCLECVDFFRPSAPQEPPASSPEVQEIPAPTRSTVVRGPRTITRTRARQRRARRQARSIAWRGAWGQIADRVFDAINLDLDNHEDDDTLGDFRRSQQQRQRELREYERWQQRLDIASRLGAREVFVNSIPRTIGQQLQQVQPVEETRDERRAWGALEIAREFEESTTTPNSNGNRKRKARSVSTSPNEPSQEPERKLKRPRTRRLPLQGEASSSKSTPLPNARSEAPASSSSAQSPVRETGQPSFLSSLLKEVEVSTPSDDENVRHYFENKYPVDPSSPATSPAPSSHNSPRALSITPPPNGRQSPPPLSLSSYVEPRFPRANYSPTRSSPDHSDSDNRSNHGASSPDIRQPRPQRPRLSRPIAISRSQEASPTRVSLTLETKESISGIVRSALKPHWHAKELTFEQYASINRDVSRKLYDEIRDPSSLDEDARKSWEKIATKEVARAVAELKA
jgi:hypothetical protein